MSPPARHPAWLAKHHFAKVRVAVFVLCLTPALWLGGESLAGALGINPLNRLLHFTGRWALILLAMTLAITPLRRLSVWVSQTAHARYGKRVSDWNWLIRLRRQLGLFSFFYAGLHLCIYVGLDAGPELPGIVDDALQRPFIVVGLIAFSLMLPLAATSNDWAIRRLGSAWRRLHRMAYLAAALALAHHWMQTKLGDLSPLPYTLVFSVLAASRVQAWRRGDRGTSEVSERPASDR